MSSAMNQARLAASYAAAVEVMKERAVSFYGAFRHLPSDRFHAVAAVYAFCRAADDVSDEVTEEATLPAPMAQRGPVNPSSQLSTPQSMLCCLVY